MIRGITTLRPMRYETFAQHRLKNRDLFGQKTHKKMELNSFYGEFLYHCFGLCQGLCVREIPAFYIKTLTVLMFPRKSGHTVKLLYPTFGH